MPLVISKSEAHQLEKQFSERQGAILKHLKSLVECESPSGDAAGSRDAVEVLVQAASGLHCVSTVERIDVPEMGQHLVIRAFDDSKSARPVMLVGHTDTVHSRGTLAINPWRQEGERLYGPGIFDMKVNCVLALEALRALESVAVSPPGGVILALTCDEEIGSFSGWPLLKRLALEARPRCALVLEPSADGRVKTARKGTGMFTMTTTGRAAHAGLDPGKGASAILELAKQIQRLNALNNSGGINVNVGVVRGGTRSNVVAAEAWAEIDVRFSTDAESQQVLDAFRQPQAFDSRVQVTVTGGINRPPLERTAEVAALFEQARAIAVLLDFDLGEAQVGGASDGNFLAAMGIPVLDGLGVDGDGAHAAHEHIIAGAIPRRGALLAGLIASE